MDFCRPSGSFRQVAACIVASLSVFAAGIVLGWPSPFIDYSSHGRVPVQLTDQQLSWMIACIDIGNFIMAVPAGRLMDRMGRKFAVNASTPLMFTGWMLILFGRQPWCLFVARLLQGAAVGIAWVVSPAYIGEMASVQIRGLLGLLVQLSYATGLLFAYVAGWLFDDFTTLAVVCACVTTASGALFLFLPESPYYLMLTGRPDDAARCLSGLRSYSDDDLQAELVVVKSSVLTERRKGNVRDLVNRDRRPLVIVVVLAVLQMACGASVLEVYGATVISSGASASLSANACAVFLGLIILLAAVPFALVVDRCGRRPLMIVSCFGTAACHAATFLSLYAPASFQWMPPVASVAGAQFFINLGIMPLLSVVQCEYFPSDTRALADTAVVLTVTLASTVVITGYQAVADAIGVTANFAGYAVMSAAGGAFCYLLMPETKCKSFAEIQMDFHQAVPLTNGGRDRDRQASRYDGTTTTPVVYHAVVELVRDSEGLSAPSI